MLILCIEDDRGVQGILRATLSHAGHETELAGSGPDGVALAAVRPFDLILLDVMMPGQDGFETYEQLRATPLHAQTPIVFLTAASTPENALRGFGMGADDYITKPFSPEILLAKIEVVLTRRGRAASADTSPDTLPPEIREEPGEKTVFDKYVVLGQIGEQAWGVVHKAWDTRLCVNVALKFLRERDLVDVVRFHREARVLANLDHPNICRIYDVLSRDGRTCIAMQYLDGPNLMEWIAEDPWPRTASTMAAVSRAVHHAHERGVIHRDIKPSNILLDADATPFISDFGMARRMEDSPGLTPQGIEVGTVAYCAPEQARGELELVTHVSDVYGLGATLYHLLTGVPPFGEGGPLRILHRVLRDDPTPPSALRDGVPPGLERVCLKAMRKQPYARYQSAALLAEALDGLGPELG